MSADKPEPSKHDWKFPHHGVVKHVATGNLYGVAHRGHASTTLEPVYIYAECFQYGYFMGACFGRKANAVTWVRPAVEFEDGRFELVQDCGFNG